MRGMVVRFKVTSSFRLSRKSYRKKIILSVGDNQLEWENLSVLKRHITIRTIYPQKKGPSYELVSSTRIPILAASLMKYMQFFGFFLAG